MGTSGHRARIEAEGDHYRVLDSGPSFTLDELLKELELHPENFSPNVLMRPLYQETVLPNIAYVGGGGEVAYWMQLKWLFQAVQLPMPVVLLRTSAAFIGPGEEKLLDQLGLTIADLFQPIGVLRDRVAHASSGINTKVDAEHAALGSFFTALRSRAAGIDPTLGASVGSAAVRAGRLVRLAPDVVLLPDAVDHAVGVLAGLPQPLTASEARGALGTTRKVVVPLLEHLALRGRTRRSPDGLHTVTGR